MRAVAERPVPSGLPTLGFRDEAYNEIRDRSLPQTRPAHPEQLLAAAHAEVVKKYRLSEEMVGWDPAWFRVPDPAQV
jgi:pyruvate-ferredoxin/flavodoxin oxidoreductase